VGDAMHEDLVRDHIKRLAQRDELAGRELIARVARECWPGGSADRSEPAALSWLRRWRPVRAIAPVPVCCCADGRCAVCN
jgi:hypothetical protein